MQNTPIQRAVRYTFLSIGILLFMLMLLRVGQNANDPLAVRGVPALFGFHSSHKTGTLATRGSSASQAELVSASMSAQRQPDDSAQTPSASTMETAPAAISGSLPVQANTQAYEAQAKAALKQVHVEPQIPPARR